MQLVSRYVYRLLTAVEYIETGHLSTQNVPFFQMFSHEDRVAFSRSRSACEFAEWFLAGCYFRQLVMVSIHRSALISPYRKELAF
jgi:hypothetical protein